MADSNGVDSDFFGTAPPPSSRHPLVANGMGALDGQDDVTIAGANNAPSTHAGATVAGFRGAPEATLTIPGSGAVPANQHNATAAGHKDHSGHGHNHHNHHNPHHHHSHHHRQTLNRQHGTISSRTTSLASDEHHYADDLDRDIPVEGIEGLRARSVHRKTSSNTVGGGHEDRDDRTSPVHESSTNHFDHPSRTSSLVPDSTVLNRSHSVAGTNQRHSSLAPYTPPTEEPQEKGQPPARTSSIKSSVAVVPARSSSKLDTTAASAEVSPVANVAKEYPYFKDHLEPRRPSSLLGHVSAYVKSLPLIPTSVSQPIAHAITFLDDLPHGALPRVVGALLVLFLFSPKLFYAMALLLVGVFVGLFAATPAKEAQVETGPATIHRLVSDMELLSFDTTEAKEMVDATQALLVPAAVDAELTQFLSLFIRDFIDAWYDPFNVSKSPEFPAAVHAAMRQALITLGFAAAHMKLVSAVSSLSQTLIDHMREYRAYESSSLSLDSYLSRHPASPFHRYSDTAQINHLLRKLSAHIVLSSVPKADRESPVVFSFLREILATSVLLPMVDKFSDPDYLNQSLVDYIEYEIKRKEEEGVAGNSISASGDGGDDSGETMDGSGASATSTPTPPAATPKQHIVKSASSDLSGDQLLIKVVEARRVPIAGSSGTLYCSVQFGRHTLRTRKVPMEAHPAWVEDFQFDWKKPATADEGVTVNIYEAKILRDELIGSVFLPRSTLKPNKFTKSWYPVDTSDFRLGSASHSTELLIETMVISINSGMGDDDYEDVASEALLRRSNSKLDGLQGPDGLTDDNGAGSAQKAVSQTELDALLTDPNFVTHLYDNQLGKIRQLYLAANSSLAISPPPTSVDLVQDPEMNTDGTLASDKNQSLTSRELVLLANLCRDCPADLFQAGSAVAAAALLAPSPISVESVSLVRDEAFAVLSREAAVYVENNPKAAAVVAAAAAAATTESAVLPMQAPPIVLPADPPVLHEHAPAVDPAVSVLVSPPLTPPRPVEVSIVPPPKPPRPRRGSNLEKPVSVSPPPNASRPAMAEPDRSTPTPPPPPPPRDRSLSQSQVSDSASTTDSSATAVSSMVDVETARIVGEIASLREQVMLIDLSIESASPQRSRGLLETKLDLMERIERLLDALNDLDKEREEADMSTSSVGRAGRSDSITNGAGAAGSALSSVRIRVTWDGVPAGPPSLSRTAGGSGSRLSSDLSLSGQICFVIEVERLEGGRGWAVQRTFADFQAAHRAISADSPKARKVPFPTLPSGGSGSGGGAIAIELERWVNLMMTDAVISRSDGMRDLVVPDTHPSRQSTSSTSQQTLPRRPSPTRMSRTLSMSSTTSTASVSSTVSGQMLGVLKSAGSAIKKAAVSTGNAVGSVGGAAASGISGLMGNSGNGDSRSQSPGPGQAPTTSAPRQRSPTRTATLPARSASTASGSPGSLAPERPYSMSLARQRFASDNTAPVPPPIPARPASADAMLAAGNVILDGEPDLDGRVAVPPKPPRLPERPPQLPERPPQLPERPHVHNAAARTSSLASTPAAMADASPRPATPPSSSTPAAPASTTVVRTLTPAELALVLECAFATLEEALNLSDPQQWMRQRGLQVVKTLLRQTYSKTLSQSLQRGFESAVAEDAVAGYLKSTREAMWPPPPPLSAAGTGASLSTSSSSSSPPQQPERTDEDKADTRMAAKRLVIAHGAAVFPGVEAVQTVAGRQNTVVGMTRLLNMVQHRDLNRGLMCQLLEALVKSVLSADNN